MIPAGATTEGLAATLLRDRETTLALVAALQRAWLCVCPIGVAAVVTPAIVTVVDVTASSRPASVTQARNVTSPRHDTRGLVAADGFAAEVLASTIVEPRQAVAGGLALDINTTGTVAAAQGAAGEGGAATSRVAGVERAQTGVFAGTSEQADLSFRAGTGGAWVGNVPVLLVLLHHRHVIDFARDLREHCHVVGKAAELVHAVQSVTETQA